MQEIEQSMDKAGTTRPARGEAPAAGRAGPATPPVDPPMALGLGTEPTAPAPAGTSDPRAGLPGLKSTVPMVMEVFIGLDTQFLQVPKRLCDLLGYTEEELLAAGFLDFTHPDDVAADRRDGRRLIAGEIESCEGEKRFVRKDGTIVWVYHNCSLVRDGDRKPAYFLTYYIDITERVAMARALRVSERRYRTLVENASMGIHEIGLDGYLTSMNSAGLEMLGKSCSEDVSRVRYLDTVDEVDRARVAELQQRALAGESVSFELGAAGGERILATHLIPIRGRDGTVRMLMGITQDVTESRRSEEQRTLMVHELDHRVKNTLATVLAMCQQTMAASATPEDFQQAYTARLRALARTHEALAGEHWQGVSLADVLELTVRPHHAWVDRVSFEGEHLLLPAFVTTPISLALNELATNAVKHGALSTPSGRVHVRWHLEGEDQLDLLWTEHDGPPVSESPARGFGLRLVHGLIEHELGGKVELGFEPTGVRCRMLVPVRR